MSLNSVREETVSEKATSAYVRGVTVNSTAQHRGTKAYIGNELNISLTVGNLAKINTILKESIVDEENPTIWSS